MEQEAELKLYAGRPADAAGRLPREMRTYDLLDALGIPYARTEHEAVDNMRDCSRIDAALGTAMCKNLFLCNRQKTVFYLLLMPGDKRFKTKELSAQIDAPRLSFAEAADMLRYLDIEPGAVSVMGLMNDTQGRVRLLIDEDLLKETFLGCHPCVNTASLRIAMADLREKFLPAVHHEPLTVQLRGE